MEAIGIDLGGTNMKAVLVDEGGAVLREHVEWIGNTPREAWLESLRRLIRDWTEGLERPEVLGVAAPGLIATGTTAVSWMIGDRADLVGLDWAAAFPDFEKVRVVNDAKAALVAEQRMGAAKGELNVMMLTLGTGVGGAAIVDGRLLEGAIGRAGHLGHICLDPAGKRDIVGTPGSLELMIGEGTLAGRSDGRFISTEELVAAFNKGDQEAETIWRRSVRALACGIVSLVNVLDPSLVILGGGIAAADQALLEPLKAEMDRLEWRPLGPGVRIKLAELGSIAGALGAAFHAMEAEV